MINKILAQGTLELLSKLCESEDEFTIIGDEFEDDYVFKNGTLMLVTVNGLVNVHHKFNDIIRMNIKGIENSEADQ